MTKCDFALLFHCRPHDLYEVLTDARMIKAFTRSDAVSEAKEGGAFSVYGGSIQGTYTELVPDEKIVMKWRMNEWAPDTYSDVIITLSAPEYGSCLFKMTHKNIPARDRFDNPDVPEKVQAGWERHYFQPIKALCGFPYDRADEDDY